MLQPPPTSHLGNMTAGTPGLERSDLETSLSSQAGKPRICHNLNFVCPWKRLFSGSWPGSLPDPLPSCSYTTHCWGVPVYPCSIHTAWHFLGNKRCTPGIHPCLIVPFLFPRLHFCHVPTIHDCHRHQTAVPRYSACSTSEDSSTAGRDHRHFQVVSARQLGKYLASAHESGTFPELPWGAMDHPQPGLPPGFILPL